MYILSITRRFHPFPTLHFTALPFTSLHFYTRLDDFHFTSFHCTYHCVTIAYSIYDGGPIISQYYDTYHCVTIAYSIQYSNMLYRFVA